jgi:hypothetical protein
VWRPFVNPIGTPASEATNLSNGLSHSSAFCVHKIRRTYSGDAMFREDHERLMSEARATSKAVRAALWRTLVTARQIEKLVHPRARKIEITLGNATDSAGSE